MDNNSKDKRPERKSGGIFGGRGFYIALFMCVALVGVYAWALLFDGSGSTGSAAPDSSYDAAAADSMIDSAAVAVGSFGAADILAAEDNSAQINRPDSSPSPTPEADSETEGQPASAGFDRASAEDEAAAAAAAVPVQSAPELFVWPVAGEIQRSHSVEALSYDPTMGDWRTHNGVDIDAQMGCKVYAVADGVVESIHSDDMLGTVVTISHGGGICSIYGNLGATPTVSVGDSVTAGTVIGSVSDSALGEIAQASHLHFAMSRDGEPVDPEGYLPQK